MTILEEVKSTWTSQTYVTDTKKYDLAALRRLVRDRVNKHNRMALQYFRKSILLQALVYALLGYVLVTNPLDPVIVLTGAFAIILYVPFSILLFKRAYAIVKRRELEDASQDSLLDDVKYNYGALNRFFNFKKLSDIILIPISSGIGIFLTFRLFIPGGIYDWPGLAALAFIVTLLSCLKAIVDENNKNFRQPLEQMELLLNEFENDPIYKNQ